MSSKVYYNSACPVCNAGIKGQRQRMEACVIGDIEWVDVHTNPAALSEVGASLEQVRERLHVKDSDGQLHVGADAFTRLWSQTRGQRWLARLVRLSSAQATYALGVQRLCSSPLPLEPRQGALVMSPLTRRSTRTRLIAAPVSWGVSRLFPRHSPSTITASSVAATC